MQRTKIIYAVKLTRYTRYRKPLSTLQVEFYTQAKWRKFLRSQAHSMR